MDRETRTRIQRATQAARRLLEDEFGEQLAGTFDIRPDGTVAEQAGRHLAEDPAALRIRARLVEAVAHHRAQGRTAVDSVAALLRESAFTTLNRFVALKMLEARGIVLECVSRGELSSGFREFQGLAEGLKPLHDHGYRLYLECLFDEMGREVRVLFDRRDPSALLWPRRTALDGLLAILNDEGLNGVWGVDETIGWVYQYFNGEDERRAMRDLKQGGSQAPRNSRELAVRNQFFTPRYVVEFLTDNTLGRTWLEMRQGRTRLAGSCRYLMKRKVEVYLQEAPSRAPGWLQASARGDWRDLPERAGFTEINELAHLAQGYELAVDLGRTDEAGPGALGPHARRCQERAAAEGWGALDLLDLWLVLFFEARAARHSGWAPEGEVLAALQACYAALRAGLQTPRVEERAERPLFVPFRAMKDPRELKVLDPACGSGHFLLYAFDLLVTIYEEAWEDESQARLRRDYHSLADLRRALPELILRYNLHGVDIDPRAAQIAALALWMRAQRAWKDGGIARAQRPLVTRTNIVVAEPMPGEKDLLDALCATLQPPVAAIVRDAFEDMKLAGEAGTLLRIEDTIGRGLERLASRGALFAGDEAHRWKAAEDEVYSALKRYAEAVGTGGFRRRLFAEDAARGFAFIDLCRQTYDVVLMNPPFGAGSLAAKALVARSWPRTKHDLYAAFVERGVGLLPAGGYLGAITSRTGFFLKSFQKWREEVILGQAPPTVFADLGAGVLDSAMVETAAYCLRRAS